MTCKATVMLANSAVRNALLSVHGLATLLAEDPLPPVTAMSGPEWVHQALLRLAHVQIDSILAERVIPEDHFPCTVTRPQFIDWACVESLQRLVAATPAQISRFGRPF